MRMTTRWLPLLSVGIVLAVPGCQQKQEVDEGAPVDQQAEAAPDTGGMAAGGETAAGEAAGGEAAGGGDVALGKQVYDVNCATCHGPNGGGDGPAGAGLQPPPANFTDAEWKYGGDLQAVKNTIMNGVPGTAMIAWRDALSEADIDAVARHEIAFSQGGGAAAP